MKKRKAASNIITTILLILLAIIALIILYNILLPILQSSAKQINAKKFSVQLDIRDVKLWVTGGASIKVRRNPIIARLDSIKIIFHEANGASYILNLDNITRIPSPIETKTINLNMDEVPINNSQIDRISIYPVIDGQIGLEFKEPESSINRDSDRKRILDAPPETVSWWTFNSNAGATITDRAGDNHGSLIDDAHINQDGELVLDCNGDYANAGLQESLDIKGYDWTVSVWVNPTDLSSIQYIIGKSDFSGSTNGRYVLLLFGNKFAAMIDDGIETTVIGNIDINPDQWVYLTAVYNRGEDLSIYVNGEFDEAIPITGNTYQPTNLPFQLGYIPNALIYFQGLVDDAIVFQKALSTDEIKGIYNNQKKI